MHICNSLSLNKKGNTTPEVPTNTFSALLPSPGTRLKPGWSLQSKQHTKIQFQNSQFQTERFFPYLRKNMPSHKIAQQYHGHRNWKKLCAADSAQSLDQPPSVRKGRQFIRLWIFKTLHKGMAQVEVGRQNGKLLGVVKSYTYQRLQKLSGGPLNLASLIQWAQTHSLALHKHQSAITQ